MAARTFRTPLSQQASDVMVLLLALVVAAAGAAFLTAMAAAFVTSKLGVELTSVREVAIAGAAMALLALLFWRGLPVWSITLDKDAAVFWTLRRHRVPYEEITFIAAGTWADWIGHERETNARPLRVETSRGRTFTVGLKHREADKALEILHDRAPNAAALDADGREYLPAGGDPQAILAARSRLAAVWAPLAWLALAGGVVLVGVCGWATIGAVREGEWSAAVGGAVIGGVGGWACLSAWWKAVRRSRGHRARVRSARSALRETGLDQPGGR